MKSRCPCGSGKKRTVCCYKKQRVLPAERVQGIHVDHDLKRVFLISNDMLKKQFYRETPKIAASFDRVLGTEFNDVSAVIGSAVTIFGPQLLRKELDGRTRAPTCARLLNTAMTTFFGCIHLARGGYRLQYMTLCRSVVETLCTVMHMMVDSSAVKEFYDGTLKSTKSITASNKVLPGFGRFWGELSNQFVHINTMHSALNPLTVYSKEDEALGAVKANMKALSWLLLVISELVFLEDIKMPRYWKIIERRESDNAIQFAPSPEERAWQARYLGYVFGEETA